MGREIERLFVDDAGSGGPAVVFVHAAAGNAGHWSEILAHVRATHRALAIDLRGHGRSQLPPDGDYSIEAFASDVARVTDALQIERFVLVGHSLGGAVSAAYAGAHPERLAGLLLLDPATDARALADEQTRGMMRALHADAYATTEQAWQPLLAPSTEAVRQRVLSDLRRTPEPTVVGSLGALLRFDPVAALSKYRGSKRALITASNDTPNAYHRIVPGIAHIRIDGTGHWAQLDDPAQINRLIAAFLTSVD
jgi:pimeloyl-ACP methyl ester carboxylesterase